jgi:hypothetical protein
MIASNIHYLTPDLFQGKTQTARDLYLLLLGELNKIGPVKETKKEISVSFENRKAFASVLIRNRSLKLILRTTHKITSPRIRNMERVAKNSYDHTILLESKTEIDEELIGWLGEAYQAGQ